MKLLCSFRRLALSLAFPVVFSASMVAEDVTIYYDNSSTMFPTVNIHYWGGPESQWPGKEMTNTDGDIWEFTFPSDPKGISGFLFCDGNKSGGEGHQTGNYDSAPKAGHIYKGADANKGEVTDEGIYEGATGTKPTVKADPQSGARFDENITVTLTVEPATTIYYTIDGSEPDLSATPYTAPLTFTETTTLKTYVENENGHRVQSFKYSKRAPQIPLTGNNLITDYYKVNPNGNVGTNRTVNMKFTKLNGDNRMCVAEDALSHWSDADLIAQGVARDIASAFRGKHEYPVLDTYSVYASYDKDYLYIGIQYVYEVWDEYGDGKADNLRAKPYQMNGRICFAFDLDPDKEFEGVLNTGSTIWDEGGKFNTFNNGTDCIWLGNTKPTVGTPALFFPNSNGVADYNDPASCVTFGAEPFYGMQDGLLPSITSIWGQEDFGYDPEDLRTNGGFVDLIDEIDPAQHTFYEFRFPLSKLGITEDYIKNTGIGLMVLDTYGQGATGCTPYDPTVFDNANTPYSKDPSSSAEKEDTDIFTFDHARIGKLKAIDPSGVENLTEETGDTTVPEYYTLQGIRVTKPADGLYIVRRGNKVTKTIIRGSANR